MSDAEDGDDGADEAAPAVELGDGPDVEGAPLGRIAARFQWGIETGTVVAREGETEIRTPDGPRPLAELLDEVDATYFGTRQEFVDAVRAVVGSGPVQTADRE